MSELITKEDALKNVYANWIKLGYEKYPKEIELISEAIRETSIKGNRSVRIKDYTDEEYPIELLRFFIANGFEVTHYPSLGHVISW